MVAWTQLEVILHIHCLSCSTLFQNVLKQIGLSVLSVDGRQIQQLRSFILRCYACFKTTSIMTKVFCPNCGNRTLKKVAVSLKEDGTQVIHLSSRKRLSARGKRVSKGLNQCSSNVNLEKLGHLRRAHVQLKWGEQGKHSVSEENCWNIAPVRKTGDLYGGDTFIQVSRHNSGKCSLY